MTLVSKYRLRPDVLQRTFDLLLHTLINIKDKGTTQNFIDGFFTPTEKIIFAKRMAIYVMLAKGINYESIKQLLKVSPPTIARASQQLKFSHKLDKIINKVLIGDASKEIWHEFAGVFDLYGKGKSRAGLAEIKYIRSKEINRLKNEF